MKLIDEKEIGWVMGPYGPQRVMRSLHKSQPWCIVYETSEGLVEGAIVLGKVFSTESACINGREPGKRKTRKTGKTHAEVTAADD